MRIRANAQGVAGFGYAQSCGFRQTMCRLRLIHARPYRRSGGGGATDRLDLKTRIG